MFASNSSFLFLVFSFVTGRRNQPPVLISFEEIFYGRSRRKGSGIISSCLVNMDMENPTGKKDETEPLLKIKKFKHYPIRKRTSRKRGQREEEP